MEQIGERRFAATTSRLEEPVRYFVEGAGLQSRTYTVSLVDPLFVSSMQVRLVPPAYTGAPAEDLPPGIGTITALRGTTAGISARSSLPVERATIVVQPRGADMATSPFAGSSLLAVVIPGPGRLRIPMQVRDDGKGGSLLDGMIPLRRSGSYHIEVVGRDGRRNVAPTEWGIVVLADGPPRIRLLQPRDTFDVDDSYLVPLQVAVDDDYGFSSLRIRYRLVASDRSDPWQAPRFLRYPLPRYLGTGGTIPYLWRLPSEPGDLYHVTIEAFDNDRSFGAKSARTATLVLRYPGGRQLREKARRDIGEVDAAVARLIEEADRTQRRMERLDRKLAAALASGSSGSDAETQQEIDNLVADHEAAERRLERIADDLATMTERRRQASSIAPETLRRYRELVRLFEQLDDASLRKRVAEIGRKIEELDAEELRAAMRDYSFDEEAFRRSLEASRTMLERLAAKSQLDDLVDEARTLAAEQEEIAREERSRFLADPRQDELAERTAEFQQEVAAATRSIAEQDPFGETASEQIAELAEDLAADNPAAAMKRGEASQKIADDLRSFADELAAMRQSIDRQQRERGAAAMEEAIADITDLAERQRALMERTKKEGSGPIDEEQRGPLARSQQELQRDLVDALDRITAADHPSTTAAPDAASSLAEAVDAMEEATRSIVGGRGQQAVGDQGRAVAALEGAAGTLGEGSKGMGEGTDGEGGSGSDGEGNGAGGSDGSLRSRLQQLAAQQQMLNMAMGEGDGEGGGQMLGENGRPVPSGSSESDGPSADGGTTPDASAAGGNGSADQAGSAKRMIEQQQRLARSLRELERDASGMVDGGDRTTDALAEATAEVDALLRQIGSGRVDDAARRRQDKILSRMLDALDATYERDRNEQRRATVGRDRPRSSPADIPPGLIPQSDAEAMPIEERLRGYSPEYHRLVRQFLLNLGDEGR